MRDLEREEPSFERMREEGIEVYPFFAGKIPETDQ